MASGPDRSGSKPSSSQGAWWDAVEIVDVESELYIDMSRSHPRRRVESVCVKLALPAGGARLSCDLRLAWSAVWMSASDDEYEGCQHRTRQGGLPQSGSFNEYDQTGDKVTSFGVYPMIPISLILGVAGLQVGESR